MGVTIMDIKNTRQKSIFLLTPIIATTKLKVIKIKTGFNIIPNILLTKVIYFSFLP
ncbi:MAG: hypothetical protein ACJA0Q_001621 [Saprospiraceae bacterium]|jgi:hypothetical protein